MGQNQSASYCQVEKSKFLDSLWNDNEKFTLNINRKYNYMYAREKNLGHIDQKEYNPKTLLGYRWT